MFTDDQNAIREAVANLCSQFDDDYWLERDRSGDFPEDFYHAFADGGWLGIAMPEARLVETADEASAADEELAGAVALKAQSPQLTHKSAAGGVALAVEGERDVRRAGTLWALADLAINARDEAELSRAVKLGAAEGANGLRLSRDMRPLAVIAGLARRSLHFRGRPMLGDRASPLIALRLSLIGR